MSLNYDAVYNRLLEESGVKSLMQTSGACGCGYKERCRACLARSVGAALAAQTNEIILNEAKRRMALVAEEFATQ